jgi:acetyl esterase
MKLCLCEPNVYPGVGHLLTRNATSQLGDFDPDPDFRADGIARMDRLLREQAYLPAK